MNRIAAIMVFISAAITISCKKSSDLIQSPPGSGTTKILPTVSTNNIQNLTLNSVYLGGKLIHNGSATVTEQGIVISTTPNPTINNTPDKFSMEKDVSNNFSKKINSHTPNTTFYVRAYAISADGVGYGNEVVYTSPVEKRWPGQKILFTQQEVIDFGALGYNRVQWLIITGTVTDLSPLKDIVIIETEIDIYGGSLLPNLHGLHNIERVGNFKFRYNTNLTDLSGLDNLEISSGDIQIHNNSALTSLNGLNNLLIIGYLGLGSLAIQDCPNIQNLHGLEKLIYITNNIYFRSNNNLSDMTALHKLQTVYGDINISNNSALTTLNGFQKITFASDVVILNNALLTDISSLNNLDSLDMTYGAEIAIVGNPKLQSLSCFNKLTAINSVSITDNTQLQSLQAFNNLYRIKTFFTVQNNPGLTNISGLENLRIAQSLTFNQNTALSNFCPLKPLFASILSNPSLVTNGNAQNPTIATILSTCP